MGGGGSGSEVSIRIESERSLGSICSSSMTTTGATWLPSSASTKKLGGTCKYKGEFGSN